MRYKKRWYTAQDGLRLYFRDYGPTNGTALPVLCLAGLTRNSHDFSRLAPTLLPNRRIICPDYRGHGSSDRDPNWKNYVPFTYINDIKHLLIALNLHQIFVIGSSFGGVLAMGMGAAMPTVLAGVLLNDIGPMIERSGVGKILSHVRNGLPIFDTWAAASAYMQKNFPDLPAKSDEDWHWITRGTFRQERNGIIKHNWDLNLSLPIWKNLENLNLWPLFRTLRRLPVVVARGQHSDILSEATLEVMASENSGLIPVTVDNVGHMPNLLETECQEALNHALARADNTNY